MERRLKLTPVNSKNRRTTTTEDEEPSSPDFRSLLEDYNLKSPSSMKIKPTRREPSHSPVHNSSSVSPTRVEEQYQPQTSTPTTTHQERNLLTNNNKPSSAARRVCSFAEERPISDEVLLSTPNRYSTSTLPPMASSFQADVDEELDYVEVKRGPTTPLVPNSAQQSEILSLFSTPNIDTPARALQTPSTSTQPTLEDTPAIEDVVMPPVLNTINNELKQVETSEEQVVDIVNVTKVETTTPNLEELEELKIEELIRGSREERLLFTDHKRALLVLTLVIVLPLVALDLGLTVFSPYSLLTLIFLSLFNAYMKPVAADICNYYVITQKKQAYLPFITSFICCLVVYFTVIFILLKKFSFESKWKHTCRENHKATLSRIERIIQLNQTCTN